MIANRIKRLREAEGLTQAELAKRLGITRSGVNAWEMGITTPSTQYIVELANLFNVTADYLLGIQGKQTLNVTGLNEKDIEILQSLIRHLKSKNRTHQGDMPPY